jgi:hypothetical protein
MEETNIGDSAQARFASHCTAQAACSVWRGWWVTPSVRPLLQGVPFISYCARTLRMHDALFYADKAATSEVTGCASLPTALAGA